MRIADAGLHEGMESVRRGARYPATAGAVPSSRAPEGAGDRRRSPRAAEARPEREGRPSGARGRRVAAEVTLVPPVRVTGVAEDPRVKGRVRVRCQSAEGTATLVIGASGVLAFNVRTGMVLDGVAWAALLREARVVHAQDAALRMLSTSRRSRRDLEQRLRRREQDPTVIGDALGRLEAIGLLDDDEFARAEAAAQLRNASRSSGAVTRRLRQRGISADVAQAAVAEAVDREAVDDAARCEAAAEKRVRLLRGLDRQAAQRRLTGFLMRRGFAPDLVFATARRALAGWAGDTQDDEGADGAM